MDEFKIFKVMVPENRRYFDDDTSGLTIKRGQIVDITQRSFRSREIRFALMRNQLLIVEGECEFIFKGHVMKIKPGKNKNLIEVMDETPIAEVKVLEKPKVIIKNKKVKEEK